MKNIKIMSTFVAFLKLLIESTLKSQDMSRTKAQPLPSLQGEGQGWGL